jgi:hypothetical protein
MVAEADKSEAGAPKSGSSNGVVRALRLLAPEYFGFVNPKWKVAFTALYPKDVRSLPEQELKNFGRY